MFHSGTGTSGLPAPCGEWQKTQISSVPVVKTPVLGPLVLVPVVAPIARPPEPKLCLVLAMPAFADCAAIISTATKTNAERCTANCLRVRTFMIAAQFNEPIFQVFYQQKHYLKTRAFPLLGIKAEIYVICFSALAVFCHSLTYGDVSQQFPCHWRRGHLNGVIYRRKTPGYAGVTVEV